MWLLKSKTFWGGVLVAAAQVIPDPKNPDAWGQAAGIIIGTIGLRHAIKKGPDA